MMSSSLTSMPRWGWGLLLVAALWSAVHLWRESAYQFPRALRDHASDVDVLLSNRVFERHGFWNVEGRIYRSGEPVPPSYKGYPPLPNWTYHFLSQLGITSLKGHRRAMTLMAWLGLWVTFGAVRRLLDWRYGLGAALYLASLPFFIRMGAGLHQYALNFLLWPALLWAIAVWVDHPRSKIKAAAMVALAWLTALSTYEYVLYALVVAGGYAFLRTRRLGVAFGAVFLIGMGTAAALALWYGINIMENGWEAFIADLSGRFERRAALGKSATTDVSVGLFKYLYRFEKELGPGAFLSVGAWLLLGWPLRKNPQWGVPWRVIALLWVGGMTWTVAFFSHALIHSYFVVVRSFYLPMGLTVTFVMLHFLHRLRASSSHRIGWATGAALLLLLQIDRAMETFALERGEIVPAEAQQAIQHNVSPHTPWTLFLAVGPKEEQRVWEYYFWRRADTTVHAVPLLPPFHLADSLQRHCPDVAIVVSKDNASLFHRMYHPDRGGPLSRLLRRQVSPRRIPPPEPAQQLMNSLRPCVAYEDERYVLIFPCPCQILPPDAH